MPAAPDYVVAVVHGKIMDHRLTFHLHERFHIMAVVPHYRCDDAETLGYAALVEWLNPDTVQPEHSAERPTRCLHRDVVQRDPPGHADGAARRRQPRAQVAWYRPRGPDRIQSVVLIRVEAGTQLIELRHAGRVVGRPSTIGYGLPPMKVAVACHALGACGHPQDTAPRPFAAVAPRPVEQIA